MVSTNVAHICHHAISQQFGPIVQKVSSALVNKGRLPLGLIIQYSGLKRKLVREALFVLIQHNLVSFADIPEVGKYITYYSIETDKVIDRLNLFNVLKIAEERFGKEGLLIARTFCLNGKLRVSDVEAYLEDEFKEVPSDPVSNGKVKQENKAVTADGIRTKMLDMITKRFLCSIKEEDMVTKKDRDMEEDAKIIKRLGNLPTAMEIKKARAAYQAQRENEPVSEAISGIKRGLPTSNSSKIAKRRIGGVEIVEEIDEESYFMINFDRIRIILRNKKIVEFAKERINAGAAEVMRCFIAYTEDKIVKINERGSPSATNLEIKDYLDPKSYLERYIELSDIGQKKANGNTKPSPLLLFSEFIKILSKGEVQFLVPANDRGIGKYRIDYENVGQSIKLKSLENIIKRKLGSTSWRVFRIILLKGKMDEKQLSKVSILPINEARQKLDQLAVNKFLELQEVPRTADRAPSRTFYLWEVNLDKCFKEALSHCQHGVANLLARRDQELASRKILLAKLMREDVRDNPDLLSSYDRNEFERLNHSLDLLDIAQQRLVELVAVFQHY